MEDEIFAFVILGLLYFVPSFVAAQKHSGRAGGIFAMNLLFGWTVIGWIVALVWSMGVDSDTDPKMKECPQCAELAQPKAKVCGFCNYDFAASREEIGVGDGD